MVQPLVKYNRKNWLPHLNGDKAYIEHVNILIDKINEIIDEDINDNASLIGDNTFTGLNTFEGQTVFDLIAQLAVGATAVTAHAGGGQANAVLLDGFYNNVSVCASSGDSTILPTALAGMFMIVGLDETAADSMQIYPAVGEQIDVGGANTPMTVVPGTVVMFSSGVDGLWVSKSVYDTMHIYNSLNSAIASAVALARPYNVYVALLTQTTVSTTSGLLVTGKTYVINTLVVGDDFANVGYVAQSTPFVATGTTPTTWTNSTEVINITDSALSAVILENTLSGDIVWGYNSGGNYIGTLVGEFAAAKTAIFIASVKNVTVVSAARLTDDTIEVDTNGANGALTSVPIEVRVYL